MSPCREGVKRNSCSNNLNSIGCNYGRRVYMETLIITFTVIAVSYVAYLTSLGFTAAYESLMVERRADETRIYLLDHVVIAGASLWIAFTTVPDFVMAHVRSIFFKTEQSR